MAPSSSSGSAAASRPGSTSGWTRVATSSLAVAVILAGFWGFMLASLVDKSATADEIAHVTAGYTYWKYNDYRLDPENGNLPQRVMALPFITGACRFPALNSEAWRTSNVWQIAYAWFYQQGNDVADMLRQGRAANSVFAIALGALVWAWARRLFGPVGGMLSLALYVLNPTILANGALMTSDTACAFFFLAATGCMWSLLHKISPARVVLGGLVLGGLCLSKMSAVLIVPIAIIMTVARLWVNQPLPVAIGRQQELSRRSTQALALAGAFAAQALLALAVIWGAYGFRYSAFSPGSSAQDRYPLVWEAVLRQPEFPVLLTTLDLTAAQREQADGILRAHSASTHWSPEIFAAAEEISGTVLTPAQARQLEALRRAPPPDLAPRLVQFCREHRLLPESFLYGHAHAWRFSRMRSSFFNGEFSSRGWKMYFPYTFAVKTPLATFGVILLALAAGWGLRKSPGAFYAAIPLGALFAVHWLVMIPSHLNIGHRHILTTYPPLLILGGAAACWWETRNAPGLWPRFTRLALAGLVMIQALEVFHRFPNYIAYFNGVVRPEKAYRHLVDSSLDWGQDLPGVKQYLDRHRVSGPVYLSYFGMASAVYYGIPARHLFSTPTWEPVQWAGAVSLPLDQADAQVKEWQHQHPDCDFFAGAPENGKITLFLLAKPAALRLTAGTYFISATELQPVEYDATGARGPWNARFESIYQELSAAVRPLQDEDAAVRLEAFRQRSPNDWQKILNDYDQFRFARLTAFLRQREPDDTVNFSILVYHLTAGDLHRALEGPPAELGIDLLQQNYGTKAD